MDVACPHCHQRILNDGTMAGQCVTCPYCHGYMMLPALAVASVNMPVQNHAAAHQPFVQIGDDGRVTATYRDVGEARLALKELKLLKRNLALSKREINISQRELRASHTDGVRRQSPKFPGGGGFGRVLRLIQTVDRSAQRKQLADGLLPLEEQKRNVEALISTVEHVMLQVEAFIHASGG